ncbi:MAG: hypothetical protein ABR520_05655 [Mycobacteriales bacterium]|nr:hypothetical protein [Frankia sp.]
MTLQRVAGNRTGEDIDDLRQWLVALEGCPRITQTAIAMCDNPVHEDDRPTWFYVEGDPDSGIARRRCLGCAQVRHVLDSEDNWTHPPMRMCDNCGQSMFELAAGFHVETGLVDWMALGLRCVGCGVLAGLTDMSVPDLPVAEVVARI